MGRRPITDTSNLKVLYKVDLTPEQFEEVTKKYKFSISNIDVDVIKIDEKSTKKQRAKKVKIEIMKILKNEPDLSIAKISKKLNMCREGISNKYGDFIRLVKAGKIIDLDEIYSE